MARRGLSAGMSGREKALGGAVLALYLAVLLVLSVASQMGFSAELSDVIKAALCCLIGGALGGVLG